MSINEEVRCGANCTIEPGVKFNPAGGGKRSVPVIGDNSVIRTNSIIYGDVVTGSHFITGHNVLIRENCRIGDHVLIGTNSILDGDVEIGNFVKIGSNCYFPSKTLVGNRVFIGPGVTVTNDRYPLRLRDEYKPEGPIIEDNVTVGGGVVICPGIRIGAGSFIAAGAVVVKDVPAGSLVVGVPGKSKPLPKKLCEDNMALTWRPFMQPDDADG